VAAGGAIDSSDWCLPRWRSQEESGCGPGGSLLGVGFGLLFCRVVSSIPFPSTFLQPPGPHPDSSTVADTNQNYRYRSHFQRPPTTQRNTTTMSGVSSASGAVTLRYPVTSVSSCRAATQWPGSWSVSAFCADPFLFLIHMHSKEPTHGLRNTHPQPTLFHIHPTLPHSHGNHRAVAASAALVSSCDSHCAHQQSAEAPMGMAPFSSGDGPE
jgi:hypothetical protein